MDSDAPVLTRRIPPPIEMVALLGPRDELLRTMERQFPLVDTHVRGNEMTFSGPAGELEIIDTLLDELLTIVDLGQPLNRDAVERSIAMLRSQTAERPADVLTMNIVSNRGRTIRPKTRNQKAYTDAIASTGRLRHRPGWHGQDIPGHGPGRRGPAGDRSPGSS